MEENIKTTVSKNKTAKVGEKYSYQYVDIAQIHEYLEENNMRYYQYIDRIGEDDYIMTVPMVIKNDELIALSPRRGCRVVDATLMGVNNPAQQQGSALTYARRYSLLMAFGLATEDDDATGLTKKKEPTEEDAKEYVINFGKKHNGHKLIDVIESDPNFIDWILNNSKDEYLLRCIELLTGQVPISDEENQEISKLLIEFEKLLIETGTDRDALYDHYKVKNNTQMSIEQLNHAIAILKKKLQKEG